MATGPNYRPNIQLPNLMGHTGDPYDLNLYPQDMIWEKPQGWDESSLGGIEGYTAGVPEGMRETISDASYKTERDLGYDYPGYDQFKNPQQYYMENRPSYGYDYWSEGPIGTTGRRPDDGGYIEYQELARHPTSWQERGYSKAEMEEEAALRRNLRSRPSLLTTQGEYNPMLQRALINQNRAKLYGNEGITGLDVQETLAPEETRIRPMDELINPEFNIPYLEGLYGDEDTLRYESRVPITGKDQIMTRPVIESDEEQYLDQGITSPNILKRMFKRAGNFLGKPGLSPTQQGYINRYGRNFQGRMQSGPFQGQNLFGTSMFGSKTAKEQALKNLNKWGKTAPESRIKEWENVVIGDRAPGTGTTVTGYGKSGMGRDPEDRMAYGGRVGYNTGGRVGILSVF